MNLELLGRCLRRTESAEQTIAMSKKLMQQAQDLIQQTQAKQEQRN